MAEDKSEGKKKDDKPVVKKVMGRAGMPERLGAKKPGPPTYEHG